MAYNGFHCYEISYLETAPIQFLLTYILIHFNAINNNLIFYRDHFINLYLTGQMQKGSFNY